jgi:hypothetical protein
VTGATSRRKGSAAERALVDHLRANGWPYAERRGGGFGGSDVIGTPGVTFESKNCARVELAAWVDQAETARIGSGDRYSPVIVKRKGHTDVGRWYAVLPVAQLLALLAEAGWAAPYAEETSA